MNKGLKRILAIVLVCMMVVGFNQSGRNMVLANTISTNTTWIAHDYGSGSGYSINVYCSGSWRAVSNSSFITLTQLMGTEGNGNIYYRISANTSSYERVGSITIYNSTSQVQVNIIQDGNQCPPVFTINANPTGNYSAGTNRATLRFYATEDWYISTSSDFVTFSMTSGNSSAYNQTVFIDMSANNTPYERTATIVLHSANSSSLRTIMITQNAGQAIYYTYNNPSHFTSSGGYGMLYFTTNGPWSISCPSFGSVSMVSGNAGTQQVNFNINNNTSVNSRQGYFVVSCCGQTFSFRIIQDGRTNS